jgi:hypothetical protein
VKNLTIFRDFPQLPPPMFIGRANTAPQVSLDKPPLIGGLGHHSLFTIVSAYANIPLKLPLPRLKPWPTQNTSRFSSKGSMLGTNGGIRFLKHFRT